MKGTGTHFCTRKAFLDINAQRLLSLSLIISSPVLFAHCSKNENVTFDLKSSSQWRALRNVFRMGHCAPSVMQTLLDIHGLRSEEMVKLSAGLPGGIGSLGRECGGITSSVLFLGLLYGSERSKNYDLPLILLLGRRFLDGFVTINKNHQCSVISSPGGMKPHLRAICTSPELLTCITKEFRTEKKNILSTEERSAASLLISKFEDCSFHCTHVVLKELKNILSVNTSLLNASWGFLGGTLLTGNTCAALTAGVLAIGAVLGQIENSYIRVLKMRMMSEEEAFSDTANRFNHAMNTGKKLGRWFIEKYGSTACRNIARADFSTVSGVKRYFHSEGPEHCRRVCNSVAMKVRELVQGA